MLPYLKFDPSYGPAEELGTSFELLLRATGERSFLGSRETVLRYKAFLEPKTPHRKRNYAKNRDKGKDKKKKAEKVEINPSLMSELIPVQKMEERCNNAIDKMKEEFSKNVSLRSTTGSIESLHVKFQGKDYELQELAQIIRKNPKTIVLNFSSFPQAIPNVLKAINSSGLNLNPQQDGTTLFVPVPKVTKEHREALAKNAKSIYIKYRDAIKDIQVEFIKKAKKQEKVSEDLVFNVTKQITALCEKYQTEAKNILDTKHEELIGK
ncbi:Ribosome-recycling factor, mitochondrial [Eumeta japonica]|uniref:Ribosome-recycling factor, mitochondrial n=1 Tax=Eumeta variegata TaxID=151549 RepID=A0A4C1ZY69_EUMVA|nr:Ribosome-recycling factor, mitochondrial [Eumeta japonica]